jgi:Flp pilus assembly protein TadD
MYKEPIKFLAIAAVTSVMMSAGCQSTEEKNKDWFEGGPMQPANADTLQMTARVLATKGRTEQAGFLLNRMAAEFPDHLGTYTEGAEILLIEGRIAEAIKWLDRGLVRFPNQSILMNDRGMCHLLAADVPAATRDFEAAYAADPADADFVSNLALVKALAGDEAGATQLWSRVVPPTEVASNIKIVQLARAKFQAANQ